MNLGGSGDDTEFAACGLDEVTISGLPQGGQTWADDIGGRLHELGSPHED